MASDCRVSSFEFRISIQDFPFSVQCPALSVQNPPHPSLSLGRLLAKRGDWSDALPHFENYARINPQDAAGQHALAICHQQLGNKATARTQFEKTISIDPGHVQSLDALGSIHLLAGNAPEAVNEFK